MSKSSQKKAVESYRRRLSLKGLSRFEVLGLESDRELLRSLARKMADGDAASESLRASLRALSGDARAKGGIFAALRKSPLVGADIEVARSRGPGRKIDL